MFKNLFSFKKDSDFLTKELNDFEQMISLGKNIYQTAVKQLTSRELPGLKLRDELYESDKEINRLERKIRKRIISHLNFQSAQDADQTFALILMSVVKDAERVGDYGKNIFEISDLLNTSFEPQYFEKWFSSLDAQLIDLFDKTKLCFLDSDRELALEIMRIERNIVKMCDQGLRSLAAASEMETNIAVCATLLYRYFKRIGAHLGNIATSVIMPVTDLDYYDESRIENR